jgi:hypothetical protein
MKRHEMWRHRYRNSRDLDHLTAEELSERLHDCINNMRTRTPGAKIGVRSPREPAGEKWITLFTEVLEECALRGYDYPGPITIAKFQAALDHAFDPIPDMDRALAQYRAKRGRHLLKFGDARWLTESIRYGRFRIASASHYDADAHNHARRDTELRRHTRLNPKYMRKESPALGDEWSAVSASTDYYLFSLSERYSSRLFGDFASDACLIVFDRARFISRLQQSISHHLPGWQVQVSRINYYDPVRIDRAKIVVPTFKPFRHEYQEEMRLLCVPPTRHETLAPIYIELGPLDDCAALVDLSSHPPVAIPHDPRDDPIQVFGKNNSVASMVNSLPHAAKIQGIALDKSAHNHTEWTFQLQYTDAAGNWHELRMPMLDGLYLLNLLRTAEQEQGLSLWNRQ